MDTERNVMHALVFRMPLKIDEIFFKKKCEYNILFVYEILCFFF